MSGPATASRTQPGHMTAAITVRDLHKSYPNQRGRGRRRPGRGARRGVRAARAERRGQDDDDRDPRRPPAARQRRGRACSARTPARPATSSARASASSGSRRPARSTSCRSRRWCGTSRTTTRAPRDPAELIELVGPGARSGRRGCASSPAASAAGSTSRSASSATPSCCSSTSRRPASTRRRAGKFWGLVRNLADTGTTVLLTTHYLEEAEALADRLGGHRRRAHRARRAPRRRSATGPAPPATVALAGRGRRAKRADRRADPGRGRARRTVRR